MFRKRNIFGTAQLIFKENGTFWSFVQIQRQFSNQKLILNWILLENEINYKNKTLWKWFSVQFFFLKTDKILKFFIFLINVYKKICEINILRGPILGFN